MCCRVFLTVQAFGERGTASGMEMGNQLEGGGVPLDRCGWVGVHSFDSVLQAAPARLHHSLGDQSMHC